MIGMNEERESGKYMLATRLDDDDDIYTHTHTHTHTSCSIYISLQYFFFKIGF